MAQRTDLTLPNTVLSAGGTLSAHDQTERRNHQQCRASPMDTKTTSTRWAKGRNDHLFVLCEHSRHARRHHCVPGEARSLDGRSSLPNRKYSPSESESANNICNTSSQYNFLLVIWRFSLTIYSHAMN